MHGIISAIGLGILGIDPVTAIYIMSMGLRKEKKLNISLFMLSFTGLSILFGTVVSVLFGTAAADLIKKLTPDDDSPFWAALEFSIAVFIAVWLIRKLTSKKEKEAAEKRRIIGGGTIKYIGMGVLFAVSCFTDPTYYGVILIGGETRNFSYSLLLMSLWLLVSQFMTFITYAANQLNLLKKLSDAVEKFKQGCGRKFKALAYLILGAVALYLLADSAVYVFVGDYVL